MTRSHLWKQGRNRLQLTVAILVGLSISSLIGLFAVRLADDRAESQFQSDTLLLAERISASLAGSIYWGEDVRAFFLATRTVDNEIFSTFVNSSSKLSQKRRFIGYLKKRKPALKNTEKLSHDLSSENTSPISDWYYSAFWQHPKYGNFKQHMLDTSAVMIGRLIKEVSGDRARFYDVGAEVAGEFGLKPGLLLLLPVPVKKDQSIPDFICQYQPYEELFEDIFGTSANLPLSTALYIPKNDDFVYGLNYTGQELSESDFKAQPASKEKIINVSLVGHNLEYHIKSSSVKYQPNYFVAVFSSLLTISITFLVIFILFDQGRRAKKVSGIVHRRTKALKQAHNELEDQYKLLQKLNIDLDEARNSAEAANKAKSEFLATVSHELRTPLNAILGFSEILYSETLGPLGDKRYKEYAGDINDSGNHLLYLINDILDLAKLEAGKIKLEFSAFDPHVLASRVMSLLRQAAAKKGLDLHYEVSDDLPEFIMGDELRLRQILINLVSNAVKYTLEGSVIYRLRSEPLAGGNPGWLIEVEDTGYGIPVDKIPILFDRFTQVEGSRVRKQGGAGLGLSICRQLVDMMEGTISVSSQLDKGSIFSVHLPLNTAEDPDREDDFI